MAYVGLRQHLKRSSSDDGRGCFQRQYSAWQQPDQPVELFHVLSLSARLADIKVLASKVCLSGAPFDYKNRGAGLARQLCLHLRRRPSPADLPQPDAGGWFTVHLTHLAFPPRCCSCLADTHNVMNVPVGPSFDWGLSLFVQRVGGTMIPIPVCEACQSEQQHHSKLQSKSTAECALHFWLSRK